MATNRKHQLAVRESAGLKRENDKVKQSNTVGKVHVHNDKPSRPKTYRKPRYFLPCRWKVPVTVHRAGGTMSRSPTIACPVSVKVLPSADRTNFAKRGPVP